MKYRSHEDEEDDTDEQISPGLLVRRIENLEAGFGRHLRTFEATFVQKIMNTEAKEKKMFL